MSVIARPRILIGTSLAMLIGCGCNGASVQDAPARSSALAAIGPAVGPAARSLVDLDGVLPADRRATWDPGLNAAGGIPHRTKACATLPPLGGGRDDTRRVPRALDRCPAGRVVRLRRGTFRISGEGLVVRRSNITLRGSGRSTRLVKRGRNFPVVIMGERWPDHGPGIAFAQDAPQGSTSIELERNPALRPGDLVTIDQLTDPALTDWGPRSPEGAESRGWFGRMNRPIGQVLEVAAVNGARVSFTTPLHIAFSTGRQAQLVRAMKDGRPLPTVRFSGIEDLAVENGEGGDGGGNIHLFRTAYSWVRNVESSKSVGASVNFDETFRCELRDSYLHSTKDPNPGGGGYGVVLDRYASDNLVENTISWAFNKVMAMRTTGGGNVIAYNYMEDGYGDGYRTIVETGLNAAHMTTPHHELFEGNQSFNFDSDSVWGNSIDITVFRNHLTGKRRSVRPLQLSDRSNRRAVGLTTGHWWYSFIGNVLGTPGQSAGQGRRFVYEAARFDDESIVPMWQLGYNGEDFSAPQDGNVVSTTLRHGNFDYVTRAVAWSEGLSRTLPPSLYLTRKPSFFGARRWPWVTPETGARYGALPARERFDRIHRR